MLVSEMTEDIADELRNSKINSKILRWLNMAQVELTMKYIFGHLNKYGSASTVAATPDILLASDFLWLKTIQIALEVRKIYPGDEQYIAAMYPDYRTMQGQEDYYYINGLNLGLFRVPSGIKAITYSYQRRPLVLTADNQTPELPEEWHLLQVQKAKSSGYRYQRDVESLAQSEAKEAVLLKTLGSSVNKRIDAPVYMGQNHGATGKLGRPTYPANYPRV